MEEKPDGGNGGFELVCTGQRRTPYKSETGLGPPRGSRKRVCQGNGGNEGGVCFFSTLNKALKGTLGPGFLRLGMLILRSRQRSKRAVDRRDGDEYWPIDVACQAKSGRRQSRYRASSSWSSLPS